MSTELQIEERKVMTFVPVGKPDPHAFFRVHPGHDWRIQLPLIDCGLGGHYVVGSAVREQLTREYKKKLVVTCVSRFGDPFLWPIRVPDARDYLDDASRSAHAARRIAEQKWIRLVWNDDSKNYDALEPLSDLGEPVWPGGNFQDLMRMAFEGRVVDSMDHPLVAFLQGRM